MHDLYARLRDRARQVPAAPAFVIQGQTYSYHQLWARVAALERALAAAPVVPEAPFVGVWTADALDTYAALIATWGRRWAYVPLNAKFPTARNRYMLETAGLRVVVAHQLTPALEALLGELDAPVQLIVASLLPDAPPETDLQRPAYTPEQLAYLLFTSGSTGTPKGVPIAQGNLNRFFATVCAPNLWGLGATDRFVQMFELTFDLSVFSTFAPLLVGGCCCTVPEGGISYLQILTTLEEQQATVALLVPSVLGYLQPYFDEIELPHLRLSLFCGEALPAKLAAGWRARLPQATVENVYGPTEATIFCTRYPITDAVAGEAHNGVALIGQPMPGVATVCLDPDTLQPADEGELCLGGDQVTPGYWHNPAKNAEAFVQHNGQRYYRTGDRVRQGPQGHWVYLGRTDQQVKIDGYRVELGEVEHHARELTGQQQVAIVAAQGTGGAWSLHLFLEHYTGDLEVLRQAFAVQLPPYMVPRTVTVLEALPLNSNGKIDRPVLRTLLTAQ